jgi:glycyl-tRNA synthetase alpha chain
LPHASTEPLSFQELILTLQDYWAAQGCLILQPFDMEMGAGTFHTATTLRALGPKPWRAAYVQPSRRPSDGRYGENPMRLQHYYQFQAILKPSPPDILERYLGSLAGHRHRHELARHSFRRRRLGEPHPRRLGSGLGSLVRRHGDHPVHLLPRVGGIEVDLVAGEITYGLERLAMYVQGVDNVYDLKFNNDGLTYGEVFLENERQQSEANFHGYDVEGLKRRFEDMERESTRLLAMTGPQGQHLVLPAYDQVLKASHLFNLMDARGAIAVAERQSYIGRIRDLCKACALAYVEQERKSA